MQPGITQFFKLYTIAVTVFFILGLSWLGLIAKPFYDHHLGYLLREKVIWGAALLFYFFFLLGLIIFAVGPAVESGSLKKALLLGLLFGFITYQTY